MFLRQSQVFLDEQHDLILVTSYFHLAFPLLSHAYNLLFHMNSMWFKLPDIIIVFLHEYLKTLALVFQVQKAMDGWFY